MEITFLPASGEIERSIKYDSEMDSFGYSVVDDRYLQLGLSGVDEVSTG